MLSCITYTSFTHGTPGPGIHVEGTPDSTELLTLVPQQDGVRRHTAKSTGGRVSGTHLASNCPRYLPGLQTVIIKKNECHVGGLLYGSKNVHSNTRTQGSAATTWVRGFNVVADRCSSAQFEL